MCGVVCVWYVCVCLCVMCVKCDMGCVVYCVGVSVCYVCECVVCDVYVCSLFQDKGDLEIKKTNALYLFPNQRCCLDTIYKG